MIKILFQYLFKKNNRLIYIFPGRVPINAGMGYELYHKNKEFKSIIIECNQYILKAGGKDILCLFEKEADFNKFEEEIYFIYITAVQVALYELYKSKNYKPDAVIGLSNGETVAAYVAGAIDLESVFLICISYGLNINKNIGQVIVVIVILQVEFARAKSFCNSLDFWVEIFIEMDSDKVMVKIVKDDLEQFQALLKLNDIPFKLTSSNHLFFGCSNKIVSLLSNTIFSAVANPIPMFVAFG